MMIISQGVVILRVIDFEVPAGGEIEIIIGEREDGESFRIDLLRNGERLFRSPEMTTRKEAEELADEIERLLISKGARIMPIDVGHA